MARTATARKTKSSGVVRGPSYDTWVRRVRETEVEAHRVVLKRYHLLLDGQKRQIWKHGPYRNFNECIQREFGISATVWTGLQQTISRFGEATIEHLGYASCVSMLRLPPKSAAEAQVFRVIEAQAAKRGGRAPSTDVVRTVVDKYVPPLKPLDVVPTIVERLRAELREVKLQLAAKRKELRVANSALHAAQVMLRKLQKKRPGK